MKVALTVLGNGRTDYLHQAVDSAEQYLPNMDTFLMVDDSGNPEVQHRLTREYPEFVIRHHTENLGMSAAVNAVFRMALDHACDYIFHLEEDMILTHQIPLRQAVGALHSHPTVAQILFQRQPLTPTEEQGGSVLAGMGDTTDMGGWSTQRHIFSLNPCLIPRRILERGWPPGNEQQMTFDLIRDGYVFGVWHGQMVEHIGTERASKWQL